MMAWILRWWKEGNGSREHLHAAEQELREAVALHTTLAEEERIREEHDIRRTRQLIELAEGVIATIKRQEQ